MAIARVQLAVGSTGAVAATSFTLTLPAAPTAGNLLIAAVASSVVQPSGIASDASVTWLPDYKGNASVGSTIMIGYVRATPASGLFTVINIGGASQMCGVIAEYSGIVFPRVDVTIAATGTTGSSIASGSSVRTTATAAELWVTGITQRGQNAPATALTAPPLVNGHAYLITTFVALDDFSNVNSGLGVAGNVTGNCFIASGTAPNNWTHGSSLLDVTLVPFSTPLPSGTVIVAQTGTFLNTANNDRNVALLEFITSSTGTASGACTALISITQQWVANVAAIDSNPAQAGGASSMTFTG